MQTVIEVYTKHPYGRPLYYPHNLLAKQFVALTGKITLNDADVGKIEAMGFTVKNLTFSPDQS